MSELNTIPTNTVSTIANPDQTYNISTANELLTFLTTNDSSSSSSLTPIIKYIKLVNNIDMKDQPFTTPANLKNVIFDGNFNIISNLNCTTTLINEIDENSIISNLSFNNYKCEALISNNKGTINNCKFNNAECTSSALVITNSNLIQNCKFNNIKLTTNILLSQSGVVANKSDNIMALIESCKINNVELNGNGFFGGIIGNLSSGKISSSSINNIRHENNSSQSYKVGGICGIVSGSTCFIKNCNININVDANTSLFIGKMTNSTINIKCCTFKTRKGDNEDNKPVDLKYNRTEENRKRAERNRQTETSRETEINRQASASRDSISTEETSREEEYIRPTTTLNQNVLGPRLREFFSVSNNYLLFINSLEGDNIINMNNIFKLTSENKMSKLDYMYILYDEAPCDIILPNIPLSKPIDTSNIDSIKQKIAANIKETALLDVDVSSRVEGTTLYITITDKEPTVTSVITTTIAAIVEPVTTTVAAIVETPLTSMSEHFETGITETVYTINSQNGTAVFDSLNATTIDPSLITTGTSSSLIAGTTTVAAGTTSVVAETTTVVAETTTAASETTSVAAETTTVAAETSSAAAETSSAAAEISLSTTTSATTTSAVQEISSNNLSAADIAGIVVGVIILIIIIILVIIYSDKIKMFLLSLRR